MANKLETDVSVTGVEQSIRQVDAYLDKMADAEEFLNGFGENRPFMQSFINNVIEAGDKADELIEKMNKGIRFNADTHELDSMSKKVLTLQKPIRDISQELANVATAMQHTTDKNLLKRLDAEALVLTTNLQKLENRIDSLNKKREQQDAPKKDTGDGGEGGIINNGKLRGVGQAFRATGLYQFGIDETVVNTAISGLGLIGDESEKAAARVSEATKAASILETEFAQASALATEAKKAELVAQEALEAVMTTGVATQEEWAAAEVASVAASEAATTAKAAETVATEALVVANQELAVAEAEAALAISAGGAAVIAGVAVIGAVLVKLSVDYYAEAKKNLDKVEEVERKLNKLRKDNDQKGIDNTRDIENSSTNDVWSKLVNGKSYNDAKSALEDQKRTLEALFAIDPSDSKLSGKIAELNRQISNLDTKHAEEETKSLHTFYESLDRIDEQARKYKEQVKVDLQKSSEQVKSSVSSLLLEGTNNNPLAKLMIDAEQATEKATKSFGRFGAEFTKQMADISKAHIADQINTELFKIQDKALKIFQELRQLENGTDSRLPQTKEEAHNILQKKFQDYVRSSNSTNVDVIRQFQRDAKAVSDFDTIKSQQELENRRRDIEEQVALAQKANIREAEKHNQIVAATAGLKPEELTDSLRRARADALRGQLQDTVQEKKDAYDLNTKLKTFLENFNKLLTEKGVRTDLGETALMNLTIDSKKLTVEEKKKNVKESAPSQDDTKKVYQFDGFGLAGGSNR